MNNDNKKKNLAKLKASLRKANFIKQFNGANLIMIALMLNWFRKFGHLFFENDFKFVNNVLYGWNGIRWENGKDLVGSYIFNKMDQLADTTVPSKQIPEIVKIAKNKKQFVSEDLWQWNADFDKRVIVTFQNGTLLLDLGQKSHQFYLNQFDPDNNAVYAIQYDFQDEFLTNQYWKNSFVGKYLTDFYSDEDRQYLQQFLASILIPQYQPQQGLVILGDGGDGKGVLMGALKKIFGKVVTELSVSKWTGNHETATLVGSLLNITSEAPSREISLDTWKSIIACDNLTIDPKYKTPFSYKPFSKQIMTVNQLPKIAIDKAVLRRMPVIRTCQSTASKNRSESFRIRFEKNIDALISFMLHGLYLLKANNFREISGTGVLRDALIYQNESTLVEFVEMCLDITESETDFSSSSDLFSTYELWRVDHGQGSKDIIKSTFSKKLNNLLITLEKKSRSGSKKVAGKSVRGFGGIVIRSEWRQKLLEEEKRNKLFKETGR
ncbi:MAG: DUF5906 domain-containing protein [Veillonellales bacterium]